MDDGTDPSSAFLDALRTRAMDEMHEASLEYGIVLKVSVEPFCQDYLSWFSVQDLAVIDRQFKGLSLIFNIQLLLISALS